MARAPKAPSEARARNICSRASPQIVEAAFSNLNPISSATDVLDPPQGRTAPRTLAAAQVAHLVEAWRYFSSALHAFLTHGRGQCVHFAYYAELRSVSSLFSGSGIFIKNYNNYYVDGRGIKNYFDGHTHPTTWKLWKQWVKQQYATDLLYDGIILVPTVALRDFSTELAGRQTATGALADCGYDLLKLSQDHTARNKNSYTPYHKDVPLKRMEQKDLDFATAMWDLLLPVGDRWSFDLSLVAFLIQQREHDLAEADVAFDVAAWRRDIYGRISHATGVPPEQIRMAVDSGAAGSVVFEKARERAVEPENVLARALFLIRLASISMRRSLNAHDAHSHGACRSWMAHWAENAGLWDPAASIAADVAEDYRLALEELLSRRSQLQKLPTDIWSPVHSSWSCALARPDACVVWDLLS